MRQFFISIGLLIKNRLLPAAVGSLLVAGSAQAQSGNALNFDGVDDYVSLPISQAPGPTNFTIEAWLNYQDNGPWTRVVDFGTGTDRNMFLTPRNAVNDAPRFAITTSGAAGEQTISGTAKLSDGLHHLAVTLSQNGTVVTGTLYVDGAVVSTNTNMTLTLNSLGPITNLYLGRSEYGYDPYLKGSLDEVRFYSAALTQAQIQTDMLRSGPSPSGLSANLLSYYNFNEGIANGNNPGVTALTDQSNSGFSGTLYNFAL
ncbi:MAG: LamG domain-containing protein, partial [Hymenobacter sp.]